MAILFGTTSRTKDGNKVEWKAVFPKGKIYLDSKNQAYIEWNSKGINKFANNQMKTQMYLDETVAKNLSAYLSFKTGTQEKSVPLSTEYGSGYVIVGVPYAMYQAYSKKIKKRVGLRGTRPFERMRSSRKDAIMNEVAAYARRINNG